jgi:hypothetical protein
MSLGTLVSLRDEPKVVGEEKSEFMIIVYRFYYVYDNILCFAQQLEEE